MTIQPSIAAGLYKAAGERLVSGGAGAAEGAGAVGGFGRLLEASLAEAARTGSASEAKAMAAMGGSAELVDVVTAISAAEVTLETVVAVRDRVVGAYQEILKMPI